MTILLVIPSLQIGGAEVFVVRLANHLAQKHRIFLLTLTPSLTSPLLEKRLSERVTLVSFHQKLSPIQTIFWKTLYLLTSWNEQMYKWVIFQRKKLKIGLLVRFLEEFCHKQGVGVINTHVSTADWMVAHYFWSARRSQTFVISMHGCYNRAERRTDPSMKRIDDDNQKVLETADRIILLTPKNAIPLQGLRLRSQPVYIPLGFERPSSFPGSDSADKGLVFGLVSRAIERKGWEEAIQAVKTLHDEGWVCQLVLVGGESEYQAKLVALHGSLPYVRFVGATDQVLRWVHTFDVGLFPSYIESESYPNAVIEYLACGKPVIGTDIGEVRNMMTDAEGNLAGQLLHYDGSSISPQELTQAMRAYCQSASLLQLHCSWVKGAFSKFDMQACGDAYEQAYNGIPSPGL